MKRKSKNSKGRRNSSTRKRGGPPPVDGTRMLLDLMAEVFGPPRERGFATEPPPTLKRLNHHDHL
jgi:hypothetical protein